MTCGGQTLLVLALLLVVLGQIVDSLPQPATDQESRIWAADHSTSAKLRANRSKNTHRTSANIKVTTSSNDINSGSARGTDTKPSSDVIRAFESSLLKMFGLTSRPRPSRKVHIPQYMLDLYHNHINNGEDISDNFNVHGTNTFSANTVRSFFHIEEEEARRHQADLGDDTHRRRFYFNMSGLPDDETLTAAELRLYRHKLSSPRDGVQYTYSSHPNSDSDTDSQPDYNSDKNVSLVKQRIDIYEVLRPATPTREAITRLLDTRVVDPVRTKWESFDVRLAVLKWRQAVHRNHGLEVHVTASKAGSSTDSATNNNIKLKPHVRLRRSVHIDDQQWQKTQPLLVTYSDDSDTRRTKNRDRRSSRHRKRSRSWNKKHRKDECRRHHLYVDFSDVGWDDWIVAPPGYQAYYCQGQCDFPLPEYINTTNHAIVQTLVHSVNPQAVPRPCCVPTELSPISMLYLDEYDKVVLKNYQDMVVVGCGCR